MMEINNNSRENPILIDPPTEGNSTEIKSYSKIAYSCGSDALSFFSKQLKGFVCGAAVGLWYNTFVPAIGLIKPGPNSGAYAIHNLIFKSNQEYQKIYRGSKIPELVIQALHISIDHGYSTLATPENTSVTPKKVVVAHMIALTVFYGLVQFLTTSAIHKSARCVFGADFDKLALIPFDIWVIPGTFISAVLIENLGLSGLIGAYVSEASLEAAHFVAMTKPFSPAEEKIV